MPNGFNETALTSSISIKLFTYEAETRKKKDFTRGEIELSQMKPKILSRIEENETLESAGSRVFPLEQRQSPRAQTFDRSAAGIYSTIIYKSIMNTQQR